MCFAPKVLVQNTLASAIIDFFFYMIEFPGQFQVESFFGGVGVAIVVVVASLYAAYVSGWYR